MNTNCEFDYLNLYKTNDVTCEDRLSGRLLFIKQAVLPEILTLNLSLILFRTHFWRHYCLCLLNKMNKKESQTFT